MKKLILLFVCVLGFSQIGFAATEPIVEERIDDCGEIESAMCDPATQHECWVDGGWWCKGVEYFGLIKTCCDGKDPLIGDIKEDIYCEDFTSEVGHNVPSTAVGSSVKIGCYTYTCSLSNGWQTSASGCACKPNITYYQPCGDCGTQEGKCNKDGSAMIWQLCDELATKGIGDLGKAETPSLRNLELQP